jgi:signal transduction histidine kinase
MPASLSSVPRRSGLYPRLMTALLAPLVVAMLVGWAIGVFVLARSFEDRALDQMERAADVIADGGLPLTPEVLRRVADLQQGDFVLLDAGRTPVLTTMLTLSEPLRAALADRTRPLGPFTVHTSTNEYVVVIRSLATPRNPQYSLVAAVTSTNDARRAAYRAAIMLGGALICAVVVLAWLGHRLVRRITLPLAELVDVADAIAGGARTVTIAHEGHDEIATLGTALESMAARLESYEAEMTLRNRSAALGEVAARIAHEIRNPLTGLKMNLQLLRERVDREERTRVEGLLDEARRLELIVHSTLAFGRDASELSLQTVDGGRMVDDIVRLMSPSWEHRGISLKVANDPGAYVEIDVDRMKQVLLNLLANAADALPEGGSICVRTETDRTRGLVRFAVEDSGPGVPADERDRIFEQTRSAKTFGLGFGLTLCKDIVSRHTGTVRVESSPSLGGARFVVELPAARAAAPASGS